MGSGVCQFACSIFCLAAAVILTVFWLMTAGDSESNTNLTFLIVAIKHEWDLKEKSDSCRNGAFIYYALSIGLGGWGYFLQWQARRAAEEKRKADRKRSKNMRSAILGGHGGLINGASNSSGRAAREAGDDYSNASASVATPLLQPMIMGRDESEDAPTLVGKGM